MKWGGVPVKCSMSANDPKRTLASGQVSRGCVERAADQLTFLTAGGFHDPSRIEGLRSFGQYNRIIN